MVQTFETINTADGSDTDAATGGIGRGIASSMFEAFGSSQLFTMVARAFEALPEFDMKHTPCKNIMKSIAEAFSSSSEFATEFEATYTENDPFCWDSPARSTRTRKRHRSSLIDKALKCQQKQLFKYEQVDTQDRNGPAYIRLSELVADWSRFREDNDRSDVQYRQVVRFASETKHVWKTSLIDIAESRQRKEQVQLQCEQVAAKLVDGPTLLLRSTIDSYSSPGGIQTSFCSVCETTKGASACGLCRLRR